MKVQHTSLAPSFKFQYNNITFIINNLHLENGVYAVPPRPLVFEWLYLMNAFAVSHGYGALSWHRIVSIDWTAIASKSNNSTWWVEDAHSFKTVFCFDKEDLTNTETIAFNDGKPSLTTFLPKDYWTHLVSYLKKDNPDLVFKILNIYPLADGSFNIRTESQWVNVTKQGVREEDLLNV